MSKTKEITFENCACRIDPSTHTLVKVTVEYPNIQSMLSRVDESDFVEYLAFNYSILSDAQERAEYICAKLTGKDLSDCSMEQAKLFHELSRDTKLFIPNSPT
jgi:hypothetical protein